MAARSWGQKWGEKKKGVKGNESVKGIQMDVYFDYMLLVRVKVKFGMFIKFNVFPLQKKAHTLIT